MTSSSRRITLFTAVIHLGDMLDPRKPDKNPVIAKITRLLGAVQADDPEFAEELEEWVKCSLALIGRVQGG